MISNPPSTTGTSFLRKATKVSLSAFAISLLLHLSVLLIVGSYVVFEGIIPKPHFEAMADSTYAPDEEIMPTLEDVNDSLDNIPTEITTPSDQSAPEGVMGQAVSSDILISSAVSNTFTLGPAIAAPTLSPKLGTGLGSGGDGTGTEGGSAGGPGLGRNAVRSLFGSSEATRSTLRGKMYDLKQAKNGATSKQTEFIAKFAASNFDRRILKDYFEASITLYTTQIFIPKIDAQEAPKAFQAEKEVEPKNWIILYEGKFASPNSGTFRFVGSADDVIIVRVNGKIVFDGSLLTSGSRGPIQSLTGWVPAPENVGKGPKHMVTGAAVAGDWMELPGGINQSIEILIGEIPGGTFGAFLFIEKKGEEYEADPARGRAPLLPIFRTDKPEADWASSLTGKYPAFNPKGPVFTPK